MPWFLHPALHPVFEALGYVVGYLVYRRLRARGGTANDDASGALRDPLSEDRRWVVIAAAAIGALVGSRLLGLAEELPRPGFHFWPGLLASGGKTVVGGLLGAWMAVEIAKLAAGIRTRTGDLFALPVCLGMAIGRIGCFLAGLADDTFGKPTALPWGVDFGDGIRRHPTQLYELLFLLLLAAVLWRMGQRPHREGALFRVFLAAYLAWRFGIDFLKPQPVVFANLNAIQLACLAGLAVLGAEALLRPGGRDADAQPALT